LRLKLGEYYFQIDFLIVCAKFFIVLQVKNRGKNWHFDKVFKQALLNNRGTMERTRNPVIEAKVQALKLKKWLEIHHITGIPIQYIFVNSNDKIQINSDDYDMNRYICNSEFLLEKIEQIESQHRLIRLDDKELKKVNRLLLENHNPDNPDLLQHYHLAVKEDILPGVQCPKCYFLPMIYKSGTWHCPKCRFKSKTAFKQAIQDYFLIIGPSITNGEARQFLQIQSRKVIHHLLTSMNLPVTGKFKGRLYHHQSQNKKPPQHPAVATIPSLIPTPSQAP
jgi:Nuclease-related domain